MQVHASPSSRVPDHCRAYALSYQGDTDYVSTCNHEHDLRSDRYDLFSNVVSEIESALENVDISSDDLFSNVVSEIESALENVDISSEEKDEMKYVVSLAKKKNRSMASSFAQINQPR